MANMNVWISVFFLFVMPALAQNPTRIINGRVIKESVFPETMRIKMSYNNGGYAGCTGSAIGHNTLITAAHCIKDFDSSLAKVTIQTGEAAGAKSQKSIVHPKYKVYGVSFDVAVILFPAQTFKVWYSIGDIQPKIGDKFVIIGYGKHNFSQDSFDNQKRYGSNVLKKVGQRLDFTGLDSTMQNVDRIGQSVSNDVGDSGGPLLINDRLVGISSSIDSALNHQGGVNCHYENLLFLENMSFLTQTKEEGARISGL